MRPSFQSLSIEISFELLHETLETFIWNTLFPQPHTKNITRWLTRSGEVCRMLYLYSLSLFICSSCHLSGGTLSEVHFSSEARVNSVLIFFCMADGAKLLDFEGEKHIRLPRNRNWFSSRVISHSIILAENSLSLLLSATVLLRLNFGGRFIISSDIPIDQDVVWLQTLWLFHVGWNRIGS